MLQHIAQHPRLPNLHPDTYLLRYFPVQIKSDHLSVTLEYLTKSYQDASYTIISSAQVDWILEVLLIAFELPLSKWEQIDQTVDIYTKWLMKPSERLKPMQKNPQVYIRRLFSHFTLLFEKRNIAASQDDEKNHIYLTNKILAIFLEMASLHGDKMDDETWEYGFKMLLGIVDVTLTSKSKGIANLAHGVLKVTFEYLLCSLSFETNMWRLFQEFGHKWANYIPTIRQWNSVCEALTLRVTRILYSVLEGSDYVQIMWQGLNSIDNPNQRVGNHITHLELPDEYVFFAWHQALHVIGNPNNITDTSVFLTALQGISRVIEILSKVGSKIDLSLWREHHLAIPYPPGTNSILRMFDSWLLETINSKHSEYNDGRAIAFRALCTIYCRKGGPSVSEDKLSLFYHAIENGLSDPDMLIVSSIILHSTSIFTLPLRGSFILIPSYIRIIKQILCQENVSEATTPALLRKCCITILSSLICLPNHYLARKAIDESNLPNCELWTNLKTSISQILMNAIQMESSQINLQHLFWSVCIFIHEYIESDLELCKAFIVAFSDILIRYGEAKPQDSESDTKNPFAPQVLITLFEVFSSITPLYSNIKSVIPEFGVSLVRIITKHIPQQIGYLKHNESLYTHFLSQAFCTLLDYIHIAGETILKHSDIVDQLISSISSARQAGRTLANPNSLFIKKIEYIAENTLLSLYNFLSIFPGSDEYAAAISYVKEELFIQDESEFWNSDFVRFFLYEDQYIFTVIEQPPRLNKEYDFQNPFGDSGCTIVVRDKSGKHVWDSRLLFAQPPEPISQLRPIDFYQGSSITGLIKQTIEHENNQALLNQLIPVEQERDKLLKLPVDHFSSVMDSAFEVEQNILEEKIQLFKNINISALPPYCPPKYEFECKFQMSRLLLTQLGFFDYTSLSNMCQLRSSAALVEDLQKLDQTYYRDLYEVGVVFVAPSQDTEHVILSNKSASEKYSRFLSSLGWSVDSSKHGVNIGKYELVEKRKSVPYYATVDSEYIFHVSTLLTEDEKPFSTDYTKKRHIIASNVVNVIWTEHSRAYFPPTIKQETPQQCNIILHPMDNGLISVSCKIVSHEPVPFVGPIFEGMVISERICSLLVRQSSQNFIRTVRCMDLGYTPPTKQREDMIQRISTLHRVKLSGREYFASLFNSDKRLLSRSQKGKLYDAPM